MRKELFYMIKKRLFCVIGRFNVSTCNRKRQCCVAIFFCLIPLICEASFSSASEEFSEVFCCKVNSANEVAHSVGGSVASVPVFSGLLEKRHGLIDFSPELPGGDKFTVGGGEGFSQPMFNKNTDKVASYASKGRTGKESDYWLHIRQVFFLGFCFGLFIVMMMPIPIKLNVAAKLRRRRPTWATS